MFTDDKITEIFVMCDEFSQKFDEFFTALSFKKNVISQKIVLFYSANFGGFSSLVYLLSQSHCVYKSKSQKPLNISFTPKQLP